MVVSAQQTNKMTPNSKFEKLIRHPAVVCLVAMVCCALWGSAFPFIKIGYSLFKVNSDDVSTQILFAGVRFFLAGVLVVLFGSAISKKFLCPKAENIWRVSALSLFQTVLQYSFFYIGLAHTTGTKSSVLNSTGVFFAVVISCILLKQEKMSWQKIIGCVIGFAGTVIINVAGGDFGGGFSLLGEGFIILSSVSYAMSSVLIKQFSKRENTVTLSGYQFALGGLVMIVFGLASGGRLSGDIGIVGILLLIYLSFLSAVAYTLWGVLLKYNDVSKVAVFGFMTPVFGCLFSALFLKEGMAGNSLKTIIALALVCLGIVIVNINKKHSVCN
jgi:drug/metabolite transporter (DMT)-like permease